VLGPDVVGEEYSAAGNVQEADETVAFGVVYEAACLCPSVLVLRPTIVRRGSPMTIMRLAQPLPSVKEVFFRRSAASVRRRRRLGVITRGQARHSLRRSAGRGLPAPVSSTINARGHLGGDRR
jgi:hypothetical protein